MSKTLWSWTTLLRSPLCVIAVVAGGWVVALGSLVVWTANPPVVNRAQVLAADVIVLGAWQEGKPPQLAVERTWKGDLVEKTISVQVPPGVRLQGRSVVPLTRISSNLFTITQGRLPNPPEQFGRSEVSALETTSEVRPFVYPATDAVLRQLDLLLRRSDQSSRGDEPTREEPHS